MSTSNRWVRRLPKSPSATVVTSFLVAVFAVSARADTGQKPSGAALVRLSVTVQRTVPNGLGRLDAFVEANGPDPQEAARTVDAALVEGLAIAKKTPSVTVKSGPTRTWPIYASDGRTIETWRMRSDIFVEATDAAVLPALAGQLQRRMMIASLSFGPSPTTKRLAEDDAEIEAIGAFMAKAGRIAGALKHGYRLRTLDVNSVSGSTPLSMRRASAAVNELPPIPAEAGGSTLSVLVSGEIELTD